jgi:glycosyltransferase involved in cell wall biosynthesis
MKLIIQIPCYNEAATLAEVINSVPKKIDGIDKIEFMVIDDGSTDKTSEIARTLKVDHIVTIPGPNKRQLGKAFRAGRKYALDLEFDILVNTDGDNQYPSSAIQSLIKPLLDGSAGMSIGDRSPHKCPHFSHLKRFFQYAGNKTISFLFGTPTPDAVSGFRAFSYETLSKLNLENDHSYTVESLAQAYKLNIKVAWVPIDTNPPTRESHLFSSLSNAIFKNMLAIIKLYLKYQPFIEKMPGSTKVVMGNIENKRNPRNPISKFLISEFDACFVKMLKIASPKSVHEAGCGEGRLAEIVRHEFPCDIRLSDLSEHLITSNILKYDKKCVFIKRAIYDLTPEEDAADTIICCEVLEHLNDPRKALSILRSLNATHYIFSVPREPIWRFLNLLRLRYVTHLGNTPGHFQHWSKTTFLEFLKEEKFRIVAVESPFPWTMVLAKL